MDTVLRDPACGTYAAMTIPESSTATQAKPDQRMLVRARIQRTHNFQLLTRLLRPFPDFDFGFIKPVRARAVSALRLHEGNRVSDLGCGPGGSLPFLRAAVGASGDVVGVEISA